QETRALTRQFEVRFRDGRQNWLCLAKGLYSCSWLALTESEPLLSEGNQVTTPDELLQTLRRYLKESRETERAVASQIGVNHHTLSRWLSDKQSPKKGRLALTACFLRRVGYL